MALEVERIGTERHQQPIGMLVRSRMLRPEKDSTDPGGLPPLILNPTFQRGAVWTKDQKVAWIESILRGLGLPAIILNRFWGEHPKYGFSEIVIDGQQRLRATAEFMNNKYSVRGEYYGDQSHYFKNNWIMSAGICPVVYCAYETERECAELYLKLLTAGTAHTSAEIKKAQEFIAGCPS